MADKAVQMSMSAFDCIENESLKLTMSANSLFRTKPSISVRLSSVEFESNYGHSYSSAYVSVSISQINGM